MEMFAHSYIDNGECKRQNEGAIWPLCWKFNTKKTCTVGILGRNSSLSLHNKLLLYKQILKPIWTYGIQLWGCTKQSNIDIIQCFQNKVLRNMVIAPWYVRNSDLHRDLQVNVVSSEIQRFAQRMKGGYTNMRTLRPYSSWTMRA